MTIKTLFFSLFLYVCLVWVWDAYSHSGPELGLLWTGAGIIAVLAFILGSRLFGWWRLVVGIVGLVALMAGCRHHGSLRRVRSGICARVLAGAVVACVIVDVSSRSSLRVHLPHTGSPPAGRVPRWNPIPLHITTQTRATVTGM